MLVEELPLPEKAIKLLKERGIRELYPPQEKAVKYGLLDGKNIIVAIPTAAGKTLIGELAMLKTVLEYGGKALYLVPLKALANEKYEEFKVYEKIGIKVALSTGDYDSSDPWLKDYDIIIATNEKADSLLRHRASWIEDVQVLIADEIHLLNYADRGPTLEIVLARFKQLSGERQIVGLSATIRNAEEIASWLNAKLIVDDWRPVKLYEGVYFNGKIIFSNGTIKDVREFYPRDDIANLTVETIKDGGQVLIFTNTRANTIRISRRLKSKIMSILSRDEKLKLLQLADKMRRASSSLMGEELANFISGGVAFHHAGLNYEQRKIVENAFREGIIKVVVATPTLAAGVNLPARRVIIHSYWRYDPRIGRYEIPVLEYKQMAGRAGRPKYDEYGEAILVARSMDEAEYLLTKYIRGEVEEITSKLAREQALRGHTLAIIALSQNTTLSGVLDFMKNTFYAYQYGVENMIVKVKAILKFLKESGFILEEDEKLKPTAIGLRVIQLYIDPLTAKRIIEALKANEPKHIMAYIHLICHTPDMPKLYLRRGEYEYYAELAKEYEGKLFFDIPNDEKELEFYLAEIKTALLLYYWIEEISEDEIIRKFDVGPGDIRSLTQTAEWIAYAASELAKMLKLNEHSKILSELRERLKYGVKKELLQLVRIPGIGRVKARILYDHGYRTLEKLKQARIEELIRIPLIGLETAKKIKQYFGLEIKEMEVKKRREKVEDKSSILYWIKYSG